MFDSGPPRLVADGHPHLEGVLGRETVEAQGREQADHASGHAAGRFGEVLALGSRCTGKAVKPPGQALDYAARDKPADLRSRHPGGFELARAGDARSAEKAFRGVGRRLDWFRHRGGHVSSALALKCREIVTHRVARCQDGRSRQLKMSADGLLGKSRS
jgi:hypothetical protein